MDSFILIFLLIFLFSIAIYAFYGYVFYMIGRKFGIGSLGGYMVPIYNLYLLNQCAGLPTNYMFLMLIPFVGGSIYGVMLFGKLAEKLGKDFWLYGLGTALIGIPVFILAFDKSTPINNNHVQENQAVQPSIEDHRFIGSTAFLVGVSGSYEGAVIPIPTEGIVIGRDSTISNIIIDHSSISKAHVNIFLNPSNFNNVIVEDLNSTNGTFVSINQGQWERVFQQTEFKYNGKIRLGTDIEIFEIVFKS